MFTPHERPPAPFFRREIASARHAALRPAPTRYPRASASARGRCSGARPRARCIPGCAKREREGTCATRPPRSSADVVYFVATDENLAKLVDHGAFNPFLALSSCRFM